MKTTKILFYVFTLLFSVMMIFSAYAYFTSSEAKESFHHIGFPDYFRIELAIAKILGVIALLPPVPGRVKEWAYAGFGINLISAAIAHAAIGDPFQNILGPVIFFLLLVGSYITYHKLNDVKPVVN